jgi:hypothetical protein
VWPILKCFCVSPPDIQEWTDHYFTKFQSPGEEHSMT